MKQRVLQFDTTRPITSAMNHSWFNVGITLVQDLEGVNYSPGQYDPIHQSFPTMPVYASERRPRLEAIAACIRTMGSFT